MIAVTQSMTLGISVDPVAAVQAKPATGLSANAAYADFLQVVAESEPTASYDTERDLGGWTDAASTGQPVEFRSAIAPDLPALANFLFPPAAHQVALATGSADTTASQFVEPQVPEGRGLVDAPMPLSHQTKLGDGSGTVAANVVGNLVGQPDAIKGAVSPTVARAEIVANTLETTSPRQSMSASDTEKKDAIVALAPASQTVANAGTNPIPDTNLPAAMPSSGRYAGIEMQSTAAHLTDAEIAVSPDKPKAQMPTTDLVARNAARAETTKTLDVTNHSVSPVDALATIAVARPSPVESMWRAKWDGSNPEARLNPRSDAISQTLMQDVAYAMPKGTAQQSGVIIVPAQSLAVPGEGMSTTPIVPEHVLVASKPRVTPNLIVTATPVSAAVDAGSDITQPSETGLVQTNTQIATYITPIAAPLSAVPTSPPAITTNLTPIIVEMTKTGSDGPVDLALAPEELGRLTISIRQEGDFVRVSMLAERPETLDLLRRHASDLLADLRQSGFSGASFSFGQSGQDPAPQFAEAPVVEDDPPPQQFVSADQKLSPPSRSHKGAGLDLRL